jgi:hypothetical protein
MRSVACQETSLTTRNQSTGLCLSPIQSRSQDNRPCSGNTTVILTPLVVLQMESAKISLALRSLRESLADGHFFALAFGFSFAMAATFAAFTLSC